MQLYLHRGKGSTLKKYSIQAGEGEFSLKEAEDEEGLTNILQIKWNYDGTFAFAMSATTLYLINDKEQVLIKVKHTWTGSFALLCTNTSIFIINASSNFANLCVVHVLVF